MNEIQEPQDSIAAAKTKMHRCTKLQDIEPRHGRATSTEKTARVAPKKSRTYSKQLSQAMDPERVEPQANSKNEDEEKPDPARCKESKLIRCDESHPKNHERHASHAARSSIYMFGYPAPAANAAPAT